MAVLLGNGDGTLQPAALYTIATGLPRWLVVADFNGDGKLDLAASVWTAAKVSVLLGNGNGTFQPRTDYAANAITWGMAAGDLDGDGYADLVVASVGTDKVSVYLGNGDGTFQPKLDFAPTTVQPHHVAIGDLDADGRPDIVVSQYYASGPPNLARLLNTSTFVPASIAVQAGTPQSTAIGTSYAVPLTVLVRDGADNPVAGIGVTFTAPASGPSGAFPGGARTIIVRTDAAGIATAPALTANATAGTFAVVGRINTHATSFGLTNERVAPVITSSAPPGGNLRRGVRPYRRGDRHAATDVQHRQRRIAPGLILDAGSGAITGVAEAAGTFTGA